MHCPNPACSSGQEHSDGVLFICTSCSHRFCVRHNMDWHEDETCAEYEERINPRGRAPERAEVRRGEDRETKEVVERTSEGCPACGVRISKVDGCDHMSCKFRKENPREEEMANCG
jgi:tRNA(Ile)-lysidine synthase TilS/MesJ